MDIVQIQTQVQPQVQDIQAQVQEPQNIQAQDTAQEIPAQEGGQPVQGQGQIQGQGQVQGQGQIQGQGGQTQIQEI